MKKTATTTIKLGDQEIILEANRFAPQAGGSVVARSGDTMVLAVATAGKADPTRDFLPLTVEYREKLYAGGIIKSSRFIKREGRPADEEILVSRLIDRSIRPVFPKDYTADVQVVVNPLSIDGEHDPEILSIIAASAAISISDIPFNGPVGAVKLGFIPEDKKTKLITNPLSSQKDISDLSLFVAGTNDSLTMLEAGANQISEADFATALTQSHQDIKTVIASIQELVDQIKPVKKAYKAPEVEADLKSLVKDKAGDLEQLAHSWATKEGLNPDDIVDELVEENPEIEPTQIAQTLFKLLKEQIRTSILKKGARPDGRKVEDIRPINVEVGLLPRTHGSALFKRGLTHALSVVTLGSPAREQLIESMEGESTKRYMHHYNMPPYASGETGRFGSPGRREIGHGALAERAIVPVLPDEKDFPYTIRVVSEIMSSNGSTSQASVCGSSLSLMDAGVPIKAPVAGIAMGLVTDGEGKFITLSDIAGVEDFCGDMDFKVAGTKDGITAIQMDVKTLAVTPQILIGALDQALKGRLHILDKMNAVISEPKKDLSQYAPRVESLTINPEKIGMIIGPGGKNIRQIQEDYQVEINIDDDGTVDVSGTDVDGVKKALAYIKGMTAEPEVGKIYEGTVKRVQPFGAFVEILPGQEGLVHVSRMSSDFVDDPSTIVKEGDQVKVRLYEIDDQGRLNLTMNLDSDPEAEKNRGRGGNNRGGQSGPRRSGPSRPPRRDSSRPQRSSGPSRFSRFQDHR